MYLPLILLNTTTHCTVLLAVTAITGDILVRTTNVHVYKAIFDNVTHGLIGMITWTIVSMNVRNKDALSRSFEVVLCTLISSLIDVDHFIAAKSFHLKVRNGGAAAAGILIHSVSGCDEPFETTVPALLDDRRGYFVGCGCGEVFRIFVATRNELVVFRGVFQPPHEGRNEAWLLVLPARINADDSIRYVHRRNDSSPLPGHFRTENLPATNERPETTCRLNYFPPDLSINIKDSDGLDKITELIRYIINYIH